MERVGFVQIEKHRLAARCHRCWKSIAYQRAIHPELWEEILKSFVRRHTQCDKHVVQ